MQPNTHAQDVDTVLESTKVIATTGLTQAEAAEVLSVSEKTIETRLYRARAKLKALLGDRM